VFAASQLAYYILCSWIFIDCILS